MKLLDTLLSTLPDGEALDVCIGLHWTAVTVRVGDQVRCGLASTVTEPHGHSAAPDVPRAGLLHTLSALELARMAQLEHHPLASIGIATLNALLPPQPDLWRDVNAEEVIASHGEGKIVALIGSFPFVPALRSRVGRLDVLELQPKGSEMPASAAPDVLPRADVVAITSMSLVNHTLESLLEWCSPQATVLLLGPSTPLSPMLFEHRIDLASGSIVTDIDAVQAAVKQGANFRQVHRAGVRLVTMSRGGYPSREGI